MKPDIDLVVANILSKQHNDDFEDEIKLTLEAFQDNLETYLYEPNQIEAAIDDRLINPTRYISYDDAYNICVANEDEFNDDAIEHVVENNLSYSIDDIPLAVRHAQDMAISNPHVARAVLQELEFWKEQGRI